MEEKEIYAEYERRHSYWSEKSLSELGYSTNLFLTLNLGFLTYVISQRDKYPAFKINMDLSINWKLFFYLAILILLFLAFILSILVTLSRLYDLRITRFIVWVRKRYFKKTDKLLSEKFYNISDEGLFKNLMRTLFCPIDFITNSDFENDEILNQKFDNLRLQGKLLGQFTWKFHKWHIASLLILSLFYSITTFFNF